MKIFVLVFLGLVLFVPLFNAQDLTPEKVATVKNDEPLISFNTALDQFVTELLSRSSTSKAFIALSGKDSDTLNDRLKAVHNLLNQRPELKERVAVSRPGTIYVKKWTETEFWILSSWDQAPYTARTADCSCNILSIQGKQSIDSRTKTVVYVTDFPPLNWLDEPISFHWTVKSGDIASGQGSAVITVKRNSQGPNAIDVRLDVGGLDEECHCANSVSFTTMIVARPRK